MFAAVGLLSATATAACVLLDIRIPKNFLCGYTAYACVSSRVEYSPALSQCSAVGPSNESVNYQLQ